MTTRARLHTLAEIEAAIWRELRACTVDARHAWRTGTLATATPDGADARTVILREADAACRTLTFYTDARSRKVAQLAAQPRGTLLLWSPQLQWQLRVHATFTVHTTGLAVSSRWATLSMTPAALDFLAPRPPGDPMEQPTPERGTRSHFAVVTSAVSALDWLELHMQGHRRAGFAAGKPAQWLQP
jgi:hypothetical protein